MTRARITTTLRSLAVLAVLILPAVGRVTSAHASTWTGFGYVGGTVSIAPTATAYNGQLHLFAVGTDRRVYDNVFDGSSWSGFNSIASTTSYAPAATVYNGQLHLFAVGTDNHVYDNLFNGSSWTGWQYIGGSVISAPAATVFNNQLHLFVIGSDSRIYDKVFGGSAWSGWQDMGGTSHYAPAATVFNGRLNLFAVGTDNHVYDNTFDGSTWSGFGYIGGSVISAPAATVFNNQLHLFVIGSDDRVYDNISGGSTWSGWQDMGGMSYDAPAAAVFNGRLHLFDVGTDNHIYDNTLPHTFIFRLDSFDIYNTMARHNDTDYVFFSVKVGNQVFGPWHARVGDLNNGHYALGWETPPLAVDATTPVIVSYQIINNGNNPNEEAIAVTIADTLGNTINNVLGVAGVGTAVTDVLRYGAGIIFANCDGVVLSDGVTRDARLGMALDGDSLITLSNGGTYSETRAYTGPDTAVGCGSNARYSVTWSVRAA